MINFITFIASIIVNYWIICWICIIFLLLIIALEQKIILVFIFIELFMFLFHFLLQIYYSLSLFLILLLLLHLSADLTIVSYFKIISNFIIWILIINIDFFKIFVFFLIFYCSLIHITSYFCHVFCFIISLVF